MMPGKIDKRIKPEQDSGDETEQDSGDEMQPERQDEFLRTSSPTVDFANTNQADEMSNTATTALQTSETSENQSLKLDLAIARHELEMTKNENRKLQFGKQMYYEISLNKGRKVLETEKQSNHATCDLRVALQKNGFLNTYLHESSVELKAALQSNDVLKDRLRAANEKADQLQDELETVRAEKSELEKKTPVEQKVWRRPGSGKRMESFYRSG